MSDSKESGQRGSPRAGKKPSLSSGGGQRPWAGAVMHSQHRQRRFRGPGPPENRGPMGIGSTSAPQAKKSGPHAPWPLRPLRIADERQQKWDRPPGSSKPWMRTQCLRRSHTKTLRNSTRTPRRGPRWGGGPHSMGVVVARLLWLCRGHCGVGLTHTEHEPKAARWLVRAMGQLRGAKMACLGREKVKMGHVPL